jgi:hypothetical protein
MIYRDLKDYRYEDRCPLEVLRTNPVRLPDIGSGTGEHDDQVDGVDI